MPMKRTAGILIAALSALFALLVVGIATGMIHRVGDFDPWLMVVPFFGFWPIVIPLSLAGIWAGTELAVHAAERRPFANIPSAIMAFGLASFGYGIWSGRADCRTGPPDGLCWLIGAFICSLSIAVLVLGSVAVIAQTMLIRRGVRPPWENLGTRRSVE
jgi:hypothetical protein